MDIIYEDKDILVCAKEAGLAVENANIGSKDLVSELKKYLKSPYLGVIHRLDMPVEGLLVFGKNKEVSAKLSAMLTKDGLNKKYLALVCGRPNEIEGSYVDYLTTEAIKGRAGGKRAKIITASDKQGKKAVLHYKEIGYRNLDGETISLLDVEIETGRFHQIRAQLSNAGIPILADQKYGSDKSLALSQKLGIRNVALVANRLSFIHPATKEKMDFEIKPTAPIFEDFT